VERQPIDLTESSFRHRLYTYKEIFLPLVFYQRIIRAAMCSRGQRQAAGRY